MASKTVERLRKRARFEFTLPNGEQCAVSAPRNSELASMNLLKDETAKSWFIIGCSLLEDDGSPTFSREVGEDESAFAKRVETELDLSLDMRESVMTAINKASGVPPAAVLEKNS